MNSYEFCYWLTGFLHDKTMLEPQDVSAIKKHLTAITEKNQAIKDDDEEGWEEEPEDDEDEEPKIKKPRN